MMMPASESPVKNSTMASVGKLLLLAFVLVAATSLGRLLRQRPDDSVATVEQNSITPGRSSAAPLYITYCAKCHGANGNGDPESIATLSPPPRNFAGTNWRFAKTHAEISRVIQQGIQGTAMPAMGHVLSEQQTAELADYVLQLSEATVAASETAPLPDDLQELKELGFTVFGDPVRAPSVNLTSSTGDPFDVADTLGQFVIMNFWGTACSHCLAEMPGLVDLERQCKDDGFVLLSICADEDDPDVIAEVANQIVPGQVVYRDDTGLVTQKYSVGALPTFVILDPEQNMIARRSGAIDWSSQRTRRAIQLLLRSRH